SEISARRRALRPSCIGRRSMNGTATREWAARWLIASQHRSDSQSQIVPSRKLAVCLVGIGFDAWEHQLDQRRFAVRGGEVRQYCGWQRGYARFHDGDGNVLRQREKGTQLEISHETSPQARASGGV